MSNGKDMIIHLIAELMKTTSYKRVNIFLNHMSVLEETLMSKLIYLIMQQKFKKLKNLKKFKNISRIDVSIFALKCL